MQLSPSLFRSRLASAPVKRSRKRRHPHRLKRQWQCHRSPQRLTRFPRENRNSAFEGSCIAADVRLTWETRMHEWTASHAGCPGVRCRRCDSCGGRGRDRRRHRTRAARTRRSRRTADPGCRDQHRDPRRPVTRVSPAAPRGADRARYPGRSAAAAWRYRIPR